MLKLCTSNDLKLCREYVPIVGTESAFCIFLTAISTRYGSPLVIICSNRNCTPIGEDFALSGSVLTFAVYG